MNNPLKSSADYEYFLYTLKESFPLIISSTVVFLRLGATLARVKGELCFEDGFKLVVRERILFHRLPAPLSIGMVMKSGRVKRNCFGMIANRILMT